MTTDDVSVKFGASIEGLVDGVNEAKESIAGLSETAKSLAEAIGVAFTLDGVKDFVEGMAQLGEQVERTASTLGISNQATIELGGIAKLTGTSLDDLAMGIERMSLNIQRSTRDATNPAAQALKVLHLNARDLIGLPADEYFDALADAVSKFNPSLNLANALMAVGGRGVTQMLPALMQGREHFAEFKRQIDEASEGLAAAVPGMAETHEKLTLLSASAQSLGARIFSTLKPAIDSAITAVTDWIQSLKTETIRDAVNSIGTATIEIARSVALFFVDAREAWDKFISSIQSGMPALHVAAGASLLLAGQAGPALEQFKAALAGVGTGQSFAAIEAGAQGARDKINEMAASMKAALDQKVPKSGSWGEAQVAAMRELSDSVGQAVQQYNKLNAAAINMGAADTARAEIEAINARIAALNTFYEGQVEHINSLAKTFQISETQKTQRLLDALQERVDLQMANLELEERLGNLSVEQFAKIEAAKAKLQQEFEAKKLKITDDAQQKELQAWQSTLNPIVSAWDSQLKGLLSGTESWATAMKNIVSQLVLEIIKKFEDAAVAKAAAALQQAFSGSVTKAATNISAISADVGQAYAGFAAFLAPTLGPAAPAAALGLAAQVQTTAMTLSVPSLDVGTNYVLSPGLAMLHAGEEVRPAATSGPYQGDSFGGRTGAGGVSITMSGNVGNQQWFTGAAQQIARAIAQYQSRTPSMGW